MEKRYGPILNRTHSMDARFRGTVMAKELPSPSLLRMERLPPTSSIMFLTTSSPTPLPEYSVTVSLVENPGESRISLICWISSPGPVIRLLSMAFFPDLFHIDPSAVIANGQAQFPACVLC